MPSEKQIQNEILRQYGTDPRLRLWRQNTGMGFYRDRHGTERAVQYGLPGQADISGILPGGIRLEIEVKGPKGRQSQEQRNFQAMIESLEGIYVLARSVDDVHEVIAHHLEKNDERAAAQGP